MDRTGKAELLRHCFLFDGATGDTLDALADAAQVVSYNRGAVLFQSGDGADGLRIVLSGLIRIWLSDSEGHELTLALMEAGDPFGEIALLDGLPRTANATATERSTCLFVPSGAVDALIERHPALARHLIALLCELLRRNLDAIGGFAFSGLDGRLATKLCELALSHSQIDAGAARFGRKFSQTDLALMLGVSREAVNKRLAALIHDGLLVMEAGRIVVPDLSALQRRARAEGDARSG